MNATVPSRVQLEVDLGAVASNFREFRRAAAPLGVVAVLKADAYGLGMDAVAPRLVAEGAAAIATADVVEGLAALEASGGRVPVLVLGALLPDEVAPAVRAGLRIPVSSVAEAVAASEAARKLRRVAVCHLALDTGMGRVGLHPETAVADALRIAALPRVRVEGLYSHFPTANVPGDRATAAQVRTVKRIAAQLAAKGLPLRALHLANTDGADGVPAACRPPFTHVRAGIGLYGPYDPAAPLRRLRLVPAATFRARLVQVRLAKAGTTIGYGRTFAVKRDMLVGTVAAGYADGLPLALSNRGSILVHGVRCPVVGRVCMDFATVSLDGAPDARPGDEAVCFGRQGGSEIGVPEWAALKGTHAWEVLCSVGRRVRRVYRDGD